MITIQFLTGWDETPIARVPAIFLTELRPERMTTISDSPTEVIIEGEWTDEAYQTLEIQYSSSINPPPLEEM